MGESEPAPEKFEEPCVPKPEFVGASSKVQRPSYKGESIDVKPGERVGSDGRFVIISSLGEGAFSTVWRVKDRLDKDHKDYAMKFTRTTEKSVKALRREVELMKHLNTRAFKWDTEGSAYLLCLAFLEGFEHKGYLGVILESMKYNLLTALERHGSGKGLPLLPTMRNLGKNLFLGLRALRQAQVIHFDVKPDNLLVAKDGETIKLADFGCALIVSEAARVASDEMMPRFYRAPGVMLGQKLGPPVDIWSAGATMYQVATDRFLFSGATNNAVLHEIMSIRGAFGKHLTTTGVYVNKHFAADGDFMLHPTDKDPMPRKVPMASFKPPPRPLDKFIFELLKKPPKGVEPDRHEFLLPHFIELLCSCLHPDPEKRAMPQDALNHRFFGKRAGDPLADLAALWDDIDRKKAKGEAVPEY